MASKTLDILIRTKDASTASLKRINKSFNVFQKQIKGMPRGVLSGISGEIKGLIAAAAGLASIAKATQIIKDADQALFNFEKSVAAANKEFRNIGSIEEWNQGIKSLSKELVIYSDTALRNAISRTVDMTKRLGLSKEQMEEVIKRSADLGAGKTDLEGAIERVTAALRGEAESAEYLGLTLNEDYVKAWHATHGAHEKAWKDLTDIEKAQVRYNVLLEQSAAFQGRAADSADTFGGTLKVVRKEIENAIVNNKDITKSMKDLAGILKDNAGNIGKMAAALIKAIGHVINFAVEYKEMLLVIGGTTLAIALVSRLALAIKALNAAFAVLFGLGIVSYIASLGAALAAAAAQATALGYALNFALVVATAWALREMKKCITAAWDWWKANKAVKESIDDLAKQKAYVNPLIKQRLKEISDQTGIAIKNFKEFERLQKQGFILYDQDAGEWIKTNKPLQVDVPVVSAPSSLDEQKDIAKDQARLERELAEELIAISGNKYDLLTYQAKRHYKEQQTLAHGNKRLLEQAERLYTEKVKQIEADRIAEVEALLKEQTEAEIRAQTARMQALTDAALAELERMYHAGEISLKEYFTRREALIDEQYRKEIAALKKLAAAEKDITKERELQVRIIEKETAHKRELIQLHEQEEGAIRAETMAMHDQTLKYAELEVAIAEVNAQYTEMTAWSKEKILESQAQVLDKHIELLHKEAAAYRAVGDEASAMMAEVRAESLRLEADMLRVRANTRMSVLDMGRAIVEGFRQWCAEADTFFDGLVKVGKETAQAMSDALEDYFFDVFTGELKTAQDYFDGFIRAVKRSIANFLADQVTKQLLGLFFGWMPPLVAAPSLPSVPGRASGGEIPGHSPTSTADNILIRSTAGEFMQPVPAVQYYGKAFMEMIRKRLISRERIQELMAGFSPVQALAAGGPVRRAVGFALPSLPAFLPVQALAAGGPVTGVSGGVSVTVPVSITGAGNADRLARVLPSEIEQTVIRVMREEMR